MEVEVEDCLRQDRQLRVRAEIADEASQTGRASMDGRKQARKK